MKGRVFALLSCLAVFAVLLVWVPVIDAQGQDTSPAIREGLCAGVNLELNSGCDELNDNNSGIAKLNTLIKRVINLLSVIVGVVAVIMIIIGGLRYITSGGSDTSVTGAKNTILYAVIGLIIVALAQLLVRFVLNQITTA